MSLRVSFALLALAVAPLRADNVIAIPTSTSAEVSIKVASVAAQPPRFGFAPLRVTIENSAAQERTWQFAFQLGTRGQFPGNASTTRSITVPAGQTRDTWIYLPVAEPSTPVGRVLAPGASAPSATPYKLISIDKTPTGTKVTRAMLNPTTGAPTGTEEIEINTTTGERTTKMVSSSGTSSFTNTSKSTPPAGMKVTYVIDPVTGSVSTRIMGGGARPLGGAMPASPADVSVIVSADPTAGAPPSARGPAPASRPGSGLPKVTIASTPVGTKITRETPTAAGPLIQEQEIDSITGAITTVMTLPAGRASPPPNSSPPRQPGTETTYNINEITGSISTNTRTLPPSEAGLPPKIIIIRGGARGSSITQAVNPTLISATGAIGAPVVAGGIIPPTTLQVEVTGPGINGVVRNGFNSTSGVQMRPFAVATALESVVRGQLSVIVRGAPNLSTMDPAQLPADWRVWSSFAGVVLGTDEFATLDAGRRAALRGWVGLGGRLWLVPATMQAKETVENVGAGTITTLAEPLVMSEPPKIVDASGTAKRQNPTVDQRAIDLWVDKLQIYGATPGLPDRDALVLEKTPLGEALQAKPSSTTWLAVFLVAFAAVVGPVNLFVFAPAAKRHRLFYTTPLIALAAALILGATILLQDGRGGDGVRRAFVVLLPGENQAAVFQEQVSVTGFLAQRTFAAADDQQLTALPLEALTPANSFSASNNTDLTRTDGRAGGDWFRNRSRQAQLVQRLAPTRGRIERVGTAPDGAPIVQSSLGTALREFACVDELGKNWSAAEIPPGKRVTLARATSASAAKLTSGGTKRFDDVLDAAALKSAGHWHARGGASDLAPIATLDSIRWQESEVLFAGVLEGGGGPESRSEAKR